MPNRFAILVVLMLLALPAFAAPKLSEADEQRLADGTTDKDGQLDQQDGFYVLLRSAAAWQGDDFSGDAGAKVAPPADFDYLKQNPAEVRGNVYLIEGWLARHDRYPTLDNMDRDALFRAGDPAWGDQVTRWTIVTEEKNPAATIIVIFNDPNAKMPKPGEHAKVRVAARFYKLWTIKDASGQPFTYPVFVGGAAEVVEEADGASESGGPSKTAITIALVMVAGAFYGLRYMMKRANNTGRQRTAALLAARRQAREEQAEDDEEDIDDLPDDPIAALDVLRKKHEVNDQ